MQIQYSFQTILRVLSDLLIVCCQDNKDIFDGYHECESPDDYRKGAEKISEGWLRSESRRVNVEGRSANVAVDHSSRLKGKPEQCPSSKGLQLHQYFYRKKDTAFQF